MSASKEDSGARDGVAKRGVCREERSAALQCSRRSVRFCAMQLRRVNVGCGKDTTEGWLNLDNSPTVRLANHPLLLKLAARVGILSDAQLSFAKHAARAGVRWANATRLPLPNASVDVLYSCHMVEHLDRAEAHAFFLESLRVLAPGGTIRVVVPDLARLVAAYTTTRDADALVESTLLATRRPTGVWGRMRELLIGGRDHRWMYDGASLCRALEAAGFVGAVALPPGKTTISDPAPLNLEERANESVYVEARRPATAQNGAGI